MNTNGFTTAHAVKKTVSIFKQFYFIICGKILYCVYFVFFVDCQGQHSGSPAFESPDIPNRILKINIIGARSMHRGLRRKKTGYLGGKISPKYPIF